jgi:hypothetical protein
MPNQMIPTTSRSSGKRMRANSVVACPLSEFLGRSRRVVRSRVFTIFHGSYRNDEAPT